MRNAEKTRRLTASDWAEEALRAIAAGGVAAVAVEPLAKRLDATKGSFYWHFADRDALLVAALRRWETVETIDVIERARGIADPVERMRSILRAGLSGELGGAIDAALLADAAHPVVGPVLSRVTAARLRFTEEIFRAIGLPPAAALQRALLAYAAYLGHHALARAAPAVIPVGAAATAYVAHVSNLLTSSTASRQKRRKQRAPTKSR